MRTCVIVVPLHISPAGNAAVFEPLLAGFAAELNGLSPQQLAADIRDWLPRTASPTFAAYAPELAHYIFISPCATTPYSTVASPMKLLRAREAGFGFA